MSVSVRLSANQRAQMLMSTMSSLNISISIIKQEKKAYAYVAAVLTSA